MSESLKKKYYQLPEKQFKELVTIIKKDPDTIKLLKDLDKKYFFKTSDSILSLIVKLHNSLNQFDNFIEGFSEFGKKQIIQSFLIDEIEATNNIESIHSTRHDIFYLLNQAQASKDKNIISITNTYSILLNKQIDKIKNLKSIRNIYDVLMKDVLDKKDIPDGKYFRKDRVFINDGLKNVHQGFYPEEQIIVAMNEFINIFNNDSLDIFIRLALSHFIFETAHPFYDGNGRMGRLLLSVGLYEQTNSYTSFILSKAINENKSKYYKILQEARDPREEGLLNQFVYDFSTILNQGITNTINNLKNKKESIDSFKPDNYSKTQNKIVKTLLEASVLSDYGVSVKEIIKYTSVSERSVVYTFKLLKENNHLEITKIGKFNYYKYK